jgi:hypothetical protein
VRFPNTVVAGAMKIPEIHAANQPFRRFIPFNDGAYLAGYLGFGTN